MASSREVLCEESRIYLALDEVTKLFRYPLIVNLESSLPRLREVLATIVVLGREGIDPGPVLQTAHGRGC